jgi:hypothetical protein
MTRRALFDTECVAAPGADEQRMPQERNKKKAPPPGRALLLLESYGPSARNDIGRTGTLPAFADRELNLLTLIKGCVAFGSDFRMVNEQIIATIVRSDKAISLIRIEPLHCTCTHLVFSLGLPSLYRNFPLHLYKAHAPRGREYAFYMAAMLSAL